MTIRNRFSAFAKRAPGSEPIRRVKVSGPVFAHPVPVTVDRDKRTGIELHAFEDGSSRYVRPGQPGHGTHKKPTQQQVAEARAAAQAREAARAARTEAPRIKTAKPVKD